MWPFHFVREVVDNTVKLSILHDFMLYMEIYYTRYIITLRLCFSLILNKERRDIWQ